MFVSFDSNTTDATSETGTAHAFPGRLPEFNSVLSGLCVAQSLVFLVVLGRSLFCIFCFPFGITLSVRIPITLLVCSTL